MNFYPSFHTFPSSCRVAWGRWSQTSHSRNRGRKGIMFCTTCRFAKVQGLYFIPALKNTTNHLSLSPSITESYPISLFFSPRGLVHFVLHFLIWTSYKGFCSQGTQLKALRHNVILSSRAFTTSQLLERTMAKQSITAE